jgi:DNA-binding response OmpR family regulator
MAKVLVLDDMLEALNYARPNPVDLAILDIKLKK